MPATRGGHIPSDMCSFTPHPPVQALSQKPVVQSLSREFILLFPKAANINSNVEMENRPGPMKVAPSPAEVPTVLILLMRPS